MIAYSFVNIIDRTYEFNKGINKHAFLIIIIKWEEAHNFKN